MRYLPLHNEVRAQWEYCNLMFIAVSHAVEAITGRTMGALLREWIWDPLGMGETFYDVEDAWALEEESSGEVKMARGYL